MKAKEIIGDDISGVVSSIDAERSDKAAIIGSTRQWKNVPNRMPVCCFFPGSVLFIYHSRNCCLNKIHFVA